MSIDPDSGAELPEDMVSPFPDPGETAKDHDAQAAGRVAMQYTDKTRFMATVALHAEAAQGIEDCAVTIPPLDDAAVAEGVNLDVTGDLVGQSRVIVSGVEFDDDEYRILIAMRELRNRSHATSPELIVALETILSPPFVLVAIPFRFCDLGHMAVIIEIGTGESPGADIQALLPARGPESDVADPSPAPRAAGVDFGRVWYDPDNVFGFAEDPEALGFGLESDPDVGGAFAMTF